MYPVSANFHTLAIQDAPKTRVRIYFIGDVVDCTDDNDVQTNGTLLVGAVGDNDSNGRIAQNGVTFTEFFNPDKNPTIGTAASSQIGMTLLNTDGALDNFQYGRCKVYLDVYDAANATWLSCPMGVYIIELPTKRKVQLINATGFDQMRKLDAICDTWWSGLNWSGGITLSQLITSLATQVGVSVSSNTAYRIMNSTVSFTDAPFSCVSATYREVLEYIAEATGTLARFDRNGALDLKWFTAPTIGGNNITIDTDTVGNQCLALDIAEYSVAWVDILRAKFAEGDLGVTVGSGTNEYTIQNNLFLNGADATAIRSKLTPIYNRLHAFIPYSPIVGRFIYDWSIEAGDIIYIQNNSVSYKLPIFQQTMTWRGGYVVADVLSDGDAVRPVLDASERNYYRLDSEMRTITIEADRINLLGYTTINNGFRVNLDGTFEANGATINGSFTANATNEYNDAIIKSEIKDGEVSVMRSIDNGTTWEYVASITDNEYPDDSFDGDFAINDSSGNYTSINPQTIQIFDGTDQSIKIEIDKGGSTLTDTNISGDLSVTGTINSIGIEQFNIAAGSSKTVTLANATGHYFVVAGSTSNHRTTIIAYATSAGAVSYTMTPSASSITVTTGTNSITIAVSGYFVKVMHFTF